MTSLEVISNDSEQPSYLREVAALLSNSRTTAEDALFSEILELQKQLHYEY